MKKMLLFLCGIFYALTANAQTITNDQVDPFTNERIVSTSEVSFYGPAYSKWKININNGNPILNVEVGNIPKTYNTMYNVENTQSVPQVLIITDKSDIIRLCADTNSVRYDETNTNVDLGLGFTIGNTKQNLYFNIKLSNDVIADLRKNKTRFVRVINGTFQVDYKPSKIDQKRIKNLFTIIEPYLEN